MSIQNEGKTETDIELSAMSLTSQRNNQAAENFLSNEDLYDGHEEDDSFTTQQLFSFAWQIARGMVRSIPTDQTRLMRCLLPFILFNMRIKMKYLVRRGLKTLHNPWFTTGIIKLGFTNYSSGKQVMNVNPTISHLEIS